MRLYLFAVSIIIVSAGRVSAGEIYLSPDGNDDAAGTAVAPLRTLARAAKAVATSEPGPGKEPITVVIRGGRYEVRKTLTFGKEFSGTKENPIRFQAAKGEVPVFDAGIGLDLSTAQVVEGRSVLERLATGARGEVYSLRVSDAAIRMALASASVRCSIDSRMMTLARYPNVGFGHIDRIVDKGEIYAQGRTQGEPPKWSVEAPIGGRFTLLGKDISAWGNEYSHVKKAGLTGYLSYDWYRERHAVAFIQDGEIQLGAYSRYGVISPHKVPRRIIVSNLLCELDTPGEFYFDEAEATLYFIPPASLNENSRLSIWGGPGLARFSGAAFVTLEGVVIEGVGSGKAGVLIQDSSRVVLAGCTLRNSSRPAVVIEGGHRCGLRSCDLYDVAHHLSLGGGNVRKLESASNFAVNCHFTQIAASDYYGRIRLSGVGNVFRNNLVHNFPGQAMVFGDCDHRIELNEFFNIGFEEGDGGAIYSGAAMWSWGNVIRNNFLHHLMCLPQAHPRGGIYPDDLDQGETIEGNVFYKAAHRAVLLNGGAGQHVRNNLFLKGYIGIYNTEGYAEKARQMPARFESGELKRGDKEDRIWRTEQVVGPAGWNEKPWASRYPLFRKIMNQEKMRFYPIECDFSGNRFAGNWRNIEYRFASGQTGVKDIGEVPFIRVEDNREISMRVFRDPKSLDFSYKPGRDNASLPEIPFPKIGLTADGGYRTSEPDKQRYRAAVRKHFARRPSYDPEAEYDPKTINAMVYFNSGRLLAEWGGLIHSPVPGRR